MPITLSKRKSFNDWIDVEDGIRLKIDYPTREQELKLNDTLLDTAESKIPRKNMMRYMNEMLRFCIKDWKGIKDESGAEVKCALSGNELEKNLWLDLISEPSTVHLIYEKIEEQLKFTETDKKK